MNTVKSPVKEFFIALAGPFFNILMVLIMRKGPLYEINLAMAKNLIDTHEVVDFLNTNRNHVEVVCTGREAPAELIKAADLVTDMQEVKHYFTLQNIPIREGIDH